MSEDRRDGVVRPLVGGSIGRRARFAQKVRVPVGLEKLLYLAARDPDLRQRLLADRAGAIAAMGVDLRPSERAVLEAAPSGALEAMIDRIDASNPRRRKFMTLVAAAATSLAAGTAVINCDPAQAKGDTSDIDTDIDTDTDSDGDTDMDAGQDASAVDTDTETNVDGGARGDIPSEE